MAEKAKVEEVHWEWREEAPSVDEVYRSLASLDPVWGVRTVDYADFVLPMDRNEKIKVGKEIKYVPTWRLYMQVAGRVKMANDACQNGKYGLHETIEIRETQSGEPLVIVTVELWERDGNVPIRKGHGLASLRGGDAPWMKAETAARGRALGSLGFGVLPGTGIASLDEIQIMETWGVDLRPETRDVKDRPRDEVIEAVIEAKEELRQLRGQDMDELDDAIGRYVLTAFSVDIRTDNGLNWEKLNKGKLLLTHSSLLAQIEAEKRKKAEADAQG